MVIVPATLLLSRSDPLMATDPFTTSVPPVACRLPWLVNPLMFRVSPCGLHAPLIDEGVGVDRDRAAGHPAAAAVGQDRPLVDDCAVPVRAEAAAAALHGNARTDRQRAPDATKSQLAPQVPKSTVPVPPSVSVLSKRICPEVVSAALPK